MATQSQGPRRIAVIGAGIVGVCAALYLQRDGHKVTLIDRDGPGEGASKGNASVIAAESCVPVATPGILWRVPGMLMDPLGPLALRWGYLPKLAPWLWQFIRASSSRRVEEISIALRALTAPALESYAPLVKSAGAEAMIRKTGWLIVYETDKKFRGAQEDLEYQRRRGVAYQILPAEEIRQLEPSLAPIFKHGIYHPENAFVTDNFRLVQVLAEDLVRGGGALVRDEATGFAFDGAGHPNAVITRGGRHEADAVVVTAGAWSRPLCQILGHDPLLDTERGYHMMYPNPGVTPRMPICSGEYTFVATPLEGGLRIAGTVELGGLKAPPDYARAHIIAERGKRMLPGLNEAGAVPWMGFRPSMPDSLPVIDRSSKHPNAYFAFGHGHLGLTLAAITGRLISDLVAQRASGFDLAPYRIDRF
jgi:glycine/D-amino acid oxidase-like deaminating enzyme